MKIPSKVMIMANIEVIVRLLLLLNNNKNKAESLLDANIVDMLILTDDWGV